MGEWTWLHAVFPLADIELTKAPIDPKIANVLVRTVRQIPSERIHASGVGSDSLEDVQYQLRIAPHNVAPFRGGPWVRTFKAQDLEKPGEVLADFREKLWEQIAKLL